MKDLKMYVDETDVVRASDPCYDHDVYCTWEVMGMRSGIYHATPMECSPEKFSIIHENYLNEDLEKVKVGTIGVDSGMAGFFIGKPNFEKYEEWIDFLKKYVYDRFGPFKCEWGVFSNTYYGDGTYNVYLLWSGKKKVGIMVDFMSGQCYP